MGNGAASHAGADGGTTRCGPAPLAPGWSVAFENGRATMTVETWDAIEQWSAAVETWQTCITDGGSPH